jgi:hypothetical protein
MPPIDIDEVLPNTVPDLGMPSVTEPSESVKDDIDNYLDELKDSIFDFQKARIPLNRLVDKWNEEVDKTQQRREIRDVEVDVKELRRIGKLDQDETIIPDRVIDTNIQREQPPYINYLKNSRRLAIFNCLSNPDVNTQRIELEFTKGMTYINWENPHYKTLDGAQTHGWDAVEVVLDYSKPLHVGIEQVGHDKLFFPCSSLDLETAPRIIRAYDLTVVTLKSFVTDFGFSKSEVGKIINKIKNTDNEPETVRVYKKFCKYDGQVYVAWFSLTAGVSDWLKAPQPLFLGIKHQVTTMVDVPVTMPDPLIGMPTQSMTKQPKTEWVDTPITQYPIFILPYRETEKPKLVDHKGRVFYDENKQEAQTAVLSAFVNGLTRAAQIYASLGADDGSGSSLKEVQNLELSGGRIYDKPVQFFHTEYPDPMVLKAMQYFDVSNDVEVNQPNFAAMNRQDSRKTATEIDAANQQQQLLNSVQLTLFSTYIRSIYNLVWLIVQSQALQSEVKFLLIEKERPTINPITNDPMIVGNQTEKYYENDFATIKELYDLRAAGDVDVVQKQEKVNQMKQDWPVISTTILRDEFLAEMLRLQYPDSGEKWATKLETQGSQISGLQMMINSLSQILMGIATDNPEVMAKMPPEDKQNLVSIVQQAQQMAGPAAQQIEQQPAVA